MIGIALIFGLTCIGLLIHAYFELLRLEKESTVDALQSNEFKIRVYNLILNGAGTNKDTLSLIIERPDGIANDIDVFTEDVRNGMINQVIIDNHPYDISYLGRSRYFVNFKIANACIEFPMVGCASREAIESVVTSYIQVIAWRVQKENKKL